MNTPKSANKTLKDFQDIIDKCVKCGVCHAHCPTYQVNKREGSVARGKIALASALLDGDTSLEKTLQGDISMCLMCGSCVTKCPQKVPTHEIVGAIRREISGQEGLSPLAKAVSTVLDSPKLMKVGTKIGAIGAPLIFKKLPQSSGLRLRFPSPIMDKRSIPKIPFKNLFDRIPEFIEGDKDKATVGFFVGCATTFIYPEIAVKMVDILQSMGYSIFTPRAQQCCGIPALSSGNGQLVEKLASKNIEVFKGRPVDHIITTCGSCNAGVGEYYRTMNIEGDDFTDKVIDFSVFLKNAGLFKKLSQIAKSNKPTKVTYHDPCHLKSQGITKEPRELLKALPNVEFIEMEGANKCCGLGGTFSAYHYEKSKEIGRLKMQGLEESGAECIATSCPGCMIQLQDSINHVSLKVEAAHVIDFLAEALRKQN